MDYQHLSHESIPPFINNKSKILILGSFPSRDSRKYGFFYAHPRNRFFKLLSLTFNEEEPLTTEERKQFLDKHNIALYDVIYECDIIGSSDNTIKNVVPIKLKELLGKYPNIKKIYTTGKTAKKLYDELLLSGVGIEAIGLPSSSPQNFAFSLDELVEAYKIILK